MLALVAALVLSASPDKPELTAWQGYHSLRLDPVVDGAVTGGLGAGWVLSEAVFKRSLAPPTCRWCDRAPDGTDTLSSLDRFGRGIRVEGHLESMDLASNLATFGLVPVAVLGTHLFAASSVDAMGELPADVLIIAEATLAALTLNQAVKFLVGRERPFVHALPEQDKPLTRLPSDNNLSFFSGHSTFAFALAAGAGTVASLRGYPRARLVWLVGLPIAATAPLLRMMADRHYFTDVLTGSVVGAAFGVAVPTLFHGRVAPGERPASVRLSPTPGGLAVSGTF